MPADRPPDGNMPSNGDGPRRDHQGGGGPAEPRTRQEYYLDLHATVAARESATARRITAEEKAATEKWDKDKSEAQRIWGKYQSKWPSAESPPADTSGDPPGTWYGDGDRKLKPRVDRRVESACDRIAKCEKDKISPRLRAVESQDPNRHLIGFEHRLKGRDRIKEKVHDGIKLLKRSTDDAISLVPDAIRYTFLYRDTGYTGGTWMDIERLKDQGFKLEKLKNSWSSDQYKGINSQWTDPDTGQRFEVQFHTHISFEAKQFTHPAYERIRTRQADALEELVLEAFQGKVTAEVPIPGGAADIPDYP
ncbi:MAG: hypothetical protein ACRDOL_40915 [Streptosporangiaceae bacterium]